MKRTNISIFFDGTGQSRDKQDSENWTNVALLYDAVLAANSEGIVQRCKYLDGVGTRKVESLSGGAFGIGLDERIEEAYSFLWQEYNNAKDDGLDSHIYIFGFSRGAYAARWLASLIQYGGIPKDSRHVRKIFQSHREIRPLMVTEQDVLRNVVIDYIGVWDTVEASVNPSFDIENVPNCVGSVRHALAMDEWRFKFAPTRFNSSEKVFELWFPGCHTDIGGGYLERGLANAPLLWIAEGAKDAGLEIDEELLKKEIDDRSCEIKYHDELVDGGFGMDAIWWLTNICGSGKGRFYRSMLSNDQYDLTYTTYANNAPQDRIKIPESCLVYNDLQSMDYGSVI